MATCPRETGHAACQTQRIRLQTQPRDSDDGGSHACDAPPLNLTWGPGRHKQALVRRGETPAQVSQHGGAHEAQLHGKICHRSGRPGRHANVMQTQRDRCNPSPCSAAHISRPPASARPKAPHARVYAVSILSDDTQIPLPADYPQHLLLGILARLNTHCRRCNLTERGSR